MAPRHSDVRVLDLPARVECWRVGQYDPDRKRFGGWRCRLTIGGAAGEHDCARSRCSLEEGVAKAAQDAIAAYLRQAPGLGVNWEEEV